MPQWKYSQFYLTSQISRQVGQCYVIFEEMCEGVISQKWFQCNWASDKYVMLLLVLLKISFWSYLHYGILQEEYLTPCMQKICNKVLVSHSCTKYWKCTLPITSSKNGILETSFLVITICCLLENFVNEDTVGWALWREWVSLIVSPKHISFVKQSNEVKIVVCLCFQIFFLQFGGYGDCIVGNCTVWTYTQTEQHKVNTYNMYTSQSEPPNPVHYEMLGYDTLLGSHYDKYLIDFLDYSPLMPPAKVFEIPGLFVCLFVLLGLITFSLTLSFSRSH